MQRDEIAVALSILVTFVAGAVASLVPTDWAWGLNYLQFLPSWYMWIYLTLAIAATAVILLPLKLTALDSVVKVTDGALWGNRRWLAVLIALGFIPVFYFLRAKTHFLGDGYIWMSNLGHESNYIQKWTEFGSLAVVRYVQSLIGIYSKLSALVAFQIISILSGAITLYNLFSIVGKLCTDRSLRFFGLVLFLTSGTLLLFFGYVEVYPVFWAAATTWLVLSIRFLQGGKGLGWVILAYAVTLLMHMQAIYFFLGFLWLLVGKSSLRSRFLRAPRSSWVSFLALIFAGGAIIFWMRTEMFKFELILLPLFAGRPMSPDYAVLSLKHLMDIAQLFFLMVPVGLPLLFFSRPLRWLGRLDSIAIFLTLSGAGSLLFLLIVDPVIGLGRDWDLFSFTIICPVLLLLHGCTLAETKPTPRLLIATLLLGLALGGGHLAVNLNVTASEHRFHSLLRHYGSQNFGGWIILRNYFQRDERLEEAEVVKAEISNLFPNELLRTRSIDMMTSGDSDAALRLALKIAGEDPYNARYLALVGQVYAGRGEVDQAELYLDRVLRLSPYLPSFLYTMARIYIGQQRYPEALKMSRETLVGEPNNQDYQRIHAWALFYNDQLDSVEAMAESFLTKDSCDAGGNLLLLRVSLEQGNKAAARQYYHDYEECGPLRQEYQSVLRDFRYVLDD